FRTHYNTERPNQARSCGNRPPAVAWPVLPQRPGLPAWVDPDAWVQVIHTRRYARTVKANGSVELDERAYYVTRQLARQVVVVEVDAPAHEVQIWHRQQAVRRLPLKGLLQRPLELVAFVPLMEQEARARWRTYLRYHRLAS